MKHKPDASWNASSTERRGVRQSLTRAGVQLGYVVTGALTNSLEALEERLESGPPASGGTAQSRMRELLNRDRAALHTRRGRTVPGAREGDESVYGFAGKPSGGTARGRMRELLNKDRAMIATLDDEPFSDLFEQSGTLPLPAAARTDAQAEAQPEPPVCAIAPAVVTAPQATPAAAPVAQLIAAARTPAVPPAPAGHATVVPPFQAPVMAALQAAIAASPRATPPLTRTPPVAVMQAPVVIGVSQPPAAPVSAVPAPQAPAQKPASRAMPVLPNKTPVGSAPVPAPVSEEGDSPIRTRSMARLLALQGHRERALSIYDELLIAEPDNAELRAEADRLRG